MKRFIPTIILFAFVCVSIPILEQPTKAEDKVEKHSIWESDLIKKIWLKIRALSPKRDIKITTAVAGTKGAEKGSEALTPAWIGEDRSTDVQEIKRYGLIEELAASENFAELAGAVTLFETDFPQSKLLPNAILLKALSLLKLNEVEESKSLLIGFKDKYPDQSLSGEAQALLDLIESEGNL